MSQKGVDIEKIATLLVDSATREENQLQKIAELESEIASLKAEQASVSFAGSDIQKEASFDGETHEMGFVENDFVSDEQSKGRESLNNWLESLPL
jgi:uncharacterized sporulation protein YeaH/YhbH (DUF444 family)